MDAIRASAAAAAAAAASFLPAKPKPLRRKAPLVASRPLSLKDPCRSSALYYSRLDLVWKKEINERRRAAGMVVIVAAATSKDEKNSNNNINKAVVKKNMSKKEKHSFYVKPDEVTGLYPEALLLREKKLQEDGRLLPDFADSEEEKLYEFLTLQRESALDLERTRHYEVIYLIHEDRIEEVPQVVAKFQDFVKEKKGKVWRLNNWGLRRLAYKIQKARRANYILMNFELEAEWVNELKNLLDKDERVIRHLVMKKDKPITEDCPPPPEFHTFFEQDTEIEDDDEEEYDDEDEDEFDDEDEEEHDDEDEEEYDDEDEEEEDEDDDKEAMDERSEVGSLFEKAKLDKELLRENSLAR